jgi:putative ABC transport system permease protein
MLLDLALKTLWRRRLRSLLTILGVAAAVQLNLMLNSILTYYDWDIQQQVNSFAGKIYVQRPVLGTGAGEDFPSMNSSMAMDSAQAILALDGVNRERSSALLFVPLVPDIRPNMPPTYFVVGIEPGHETAYLSNLGAEEGKIILPTEHSVILGHGAAKHYQPVGSNAASKPGDVVQIQGVEFTVTGVLQQASTLYSGAILMPLETAQELFHHPDNVSAVVVTALKVEDIGTIKTDIEREFPALKASSQDEIAKNAKQMMVMQRMFFKIIQNSAILSTIMIVMVVVLVAVMEQRKDIGTLRAVGSRKWRILAMVVGESSIFGLAGGLVALPISILVGKWMGYGLFLSGADTMRLWLGTLGICLLIGIAASILPAWLALRVDPLEALRSE